MYILLNSTFFLTVLYSSNSHNDIVLVYIHMYACTFFLNTVHPLPAPSGVMVDGVDDISVRVSWQTVDDADRYTVTFTKTTGNSQQGLCVLDNHRAHVSVNVPSIS